MGTLFELQSRGLTEVWYAANQPLYFPPLYMVNRYLTVDAVVMMEEAQFTRNTYQNYALLTDKAFANVPLPGPCAANHTRLTLPLKDRNRRPLNEIEINDYSGWLETLEKTLTNLYCKHGPFEWRLRTLMPRLESCVQTQAGVCWAIHQWLWEEMNITATLLRSTDLVPQRPMDATAWLVEMGKSLAADRYLCGRAGADAYLDTKQFTDAEIKVETQDWRMKPFPIHGKMQDDARTSILDLLMTETTKGVYECLQG